MARLPRTLHNRCARWQELCAKVRRSKAAHSATVRGRRARRWQYLAAVHERVGFQLVDFSTIFHSCTTEEGKQDSVA